MTKIKYTPLGNVKMILGTRKLFKNTNRPVQIQSSPIQHRKIAEWFQWNIVILHGSCDMLLNYSCKIPTMLRCPLFIILQRNVPAILQCNVFG